MFEATIETAADQLGVQPLAVEKDYWVCCALRAMTIEHPGEIVFKGGTSLEKLRLIQRFSEDLDLLVVGSYESVGAQKAALKRMLNSAAVATAADATETVSGGNPGTFWRRGYLNPSLSHRVEAGAFADPGAILVELGQTGGPNPHSVRSVTSLLSRELADSGFEVDEWLDLAAFDVQILHPGRTLIEKLLRVNNFAMNLDSVVPEHGWPRIGRQFYDIYALLGSAEVQDLLADRLLAREIIDSARAVSAAIDRPDADVPCGGFASSPIFDEAGEFAGRLSDEHELAMRDLYYGTDDAPSFSAVLARVHENAALLDPR